MNKEKRFDYVYAVANTEIVVPPKHHLETFGSTMLNYRLVCETMDDVNKTNVRTGRMQALKPQVITPHEYSKMVLEGFGEEARKYVDWLKEHEAYFRVLRYGYTLKQESFSMETVSEPLDVVLDRVKKDAMQSSDPFTAVIKGVDDPWDVCLVKLFLFSVQQSAQKNIAEMAQHHLFEMRDGLPYQVREEIEQAFKAAERDHSLINALGKLLQEKDVFPQFEDRFFRLLRQQG